MAFLYLQTFPASGSDLVSFFIDDFQLTYIPPPTIQTGIPSLFQTLSSYFPLGGEVDSTDLSGIHATLLSKHFNSIVSGNDMKWSSVEKTKGSFSYGAADNQVGLAVCNNMQVRGHNLLWATGAQTPAYATGDGTNSPANQATVIANIQEHIQNEVQHFGTKVYVWDVVNEPIDPSQPDCLVHGPFYQVLGKSYIDVALQAARQFAPPGTQLFINDFNTAIPNKLACLIQVVQDLQSRGIPIDGIGHEMHNAINFPSPASMVNAIQTVTNNFPTLNQQITELDMSVYNGGDNTSNYGANGGTVPPSLLAEQGYLYKQYFDAFRQLDGQLKSITFWGIADDDTWLDSFPINRLDMPLPFDTGLQAKPAYWGIVDPTQLPGWGLNFKISSKTGQVSGARTWTITATNPSSVGPAYSTQITGLTLTQTGGAACSPVITPPAPGFPVHLGDIAAGSTANASFTIDFTGCPATARFTLSMPWNSAVYNTGTLVSGNQFQ
jgi:endo-1,4-beta-xylanase